MKTKINVCWLVLFSLLPTFGSAQVYLRVEHVFDPVENSMHGSIARAIGVTSSKAKIGMMNLAYNTCRFTQLKIAVAKGKVCPGVKGIVLYRICLIYRYIIK